MLFYPICLSDRVSTHGLTTTLDCRYLLHPFLPCMVIFRLVDCCEILTFSDLCQSIIGVVSGLLPERQIETSKSELHRALRLQVYLLYMHCYERGLFCFVN